MSGLSMDLLWLILQHLPAHEIMNKRRVSMLWKAAVDNVSMEEWRELYCSRVCAVLEVASDFDWKRATIGASRTVGVVAECTWHNVVVRVCAPWKSTNSINPSLHKGVVRCPEPDIGTHVVEYVYDDMFTLRGMGRSCRHTGKECFNCRRKRQCLFMVYDYYIRPVDCESVQLDHSLGAWLCDFEVQVGP